MCYQKTSSARDLKLGLPRRTAGIEFCPPTTLGGITTETMIDLSSRRYFFGRLGVERSGFRPASFRRFLRKSTRFGIGISSPCGVFCVFSLMR